MKIPDLRKPSTNTKDVQRLSCPGHLSFSAGFSKIFGENLPAEREVQNWG